ncbi:MAG TPA: hypothetical protein VIB08_05345 [Thermoanaerobaculia bacterium]|jgi:hypothetical protein
MKKKLVPLAILLLVVVALVAGRRLLPAEEKPAEITVKGTVVDMHCYVTHGIHDAKHTACANACIKRGVPAGLLAEDGTLYVLFEEKPFSVKDRVAGLADVAVVVKGLSVERGGVKGLQVTSLEKAAP